MENDRVIRLRLRFRGLVQGVGFRWRACRAARSVGATGWVRNEMDGSVAMEIQGTDKQIDAVLSALDRGLYIRIEETERFAIPPETGERDFAALDDAW